MMKPSGSTQPQRVATSHSAVRAWKEIEPNSPAAHDVELIQRKKGATVYRITLDSGAMVAKRSSTASIRLERLIYEDILPKIGLQTVGIYGSTAGDDDGFSWLFLEEVRGEGFEDYDPLHRDLAVRWLAILHGRTSAVESARTLPARGPDYYGSVVLKEAHEYMQRLEVRLLPAVQRDIVYRVLDHLDALQSIWSAIEQSCSAFPECLIHGDFDGGNVLVQGKGSKKRLRVMDWELAGWGSPATDITGLDTGTYCHLIREYWPDVELRQIIQMAHVGAIFRYVDWTRGLAGDVRQERLSETMWKLSYCEEHLAHARHVAGF